MRRVNLEKVRLPCTRPARSADAGSSRRTSSAWTFRGSSAQVAACCSSPRAAGNIDEGDNALGRRRLPDRPLRSPCGRDVRLTPDAMDRVQHGRAPLSVLRTSACHRSASPLAHALHTPLPRTVPACDNLFMDKLVTTTIPDLRANRSPLHITGMVTWECRHCGTWNQHRVRASSWRARCGNRLCKRWTLLMAIQQDVPVGSHPYYRHL